jgi:hypothetical protein
MKMSNNTKILQCVLQYFSGLPTFVPRSCVFFLLRRVEAEVATELPKKIVVIYHGMSALQKKYYQAILMKDLNNQQTFVYLETK